VYVAKGEITVDRNMLSDAELDDLLTVAGETKPVSRAALDDASVRYALDDAWHLAESNAARFERRRARRPVHRRRLAAAGTAAVVVGVASLVGVEGFGGGAGSAGFPLAVSPAAAAQLNKVAHVAAAQPGLSAGQWLYVELTSRAPSADSHSSAKELVQDWFAANGVERERVTLAGAATRDRVITDPNRGSAPTPGVNLAEPPSDVKTLLADIASSTVPKAGASPAKDPDWYWIDLGNVLESSTSPQLRSLAFTALKYLPGVTVLANQTDQLGRAGTELSFTGSGPTLTIIVSPSTGQMLESYNTGAIANRVIYTRQTVVSSETALPGGGTQPLTASESTATTPDSTTSAQALTAPNVPSPGPSSGTSTAPSSVTSAQALTAPNVPSPGPSSGTSTAPNSATSTAPGAATR
jgi:hypothetical protein